VSTQQRPASPVAAAPRPESKTTNEVFVAMKPRRAHQSVMQWLVSRMLQALGHCCQISCLLQMLRAAAAVDQKSEQQQQQYHQRQQQPQQLLYEGPRLLDTRGLQPAPCCCNMRLCASFAGATIASTCVCNLRAKWRWERCRAEASAGAAARPALCGNRHIKVWP
jgi:hypothetical protein